MVGCVASRLDEIHHADSCRVLAVDQASVDVVFCGCVTGVVGVWAVAVVWVWWGEGSGGGFVKEWVWG